MTEFNENTARSGARRGLRSVAAAGLVLALTGGIVGTLAVGQSFAAAPSHAAQVLNAAANAADHAPAKSGQFEYIDVLHLTSTPTPVEHDQRWLSVDGSQDGLEVGSGWWNNTTTIPANSYHPGDSLKDAPYDVIAKLPTDSAQLSKILANDPYVLGDEKYNGTAPNVAVWGLMRLLVETAPPAQEAALFRVAAGLEGVGYSAGATDAAGRSGEAVGMEDPRLGFIQFIFDKGDHRFLGERVLGNPTGSTGVEFNDAVLTRGFVDSVGQLPH
jgi:hypothetical protein